MSRIFPVMLLALAACGDSSDRREVTYGDMDIIESRDVDKGKILITRRSPGGGRPEI
jgi:hypothetical protein